MHPAPTADQYQAAYAAFHRAQNAQRNIDRLNAYTRLNEGMRESLRRSYQDKAAAEAEVRAYFAPPAEMAVAA